MKKIVFTLALAAGLSVSAHAQKKVLLNEDFSSVEVNYEAHYAPLSLPGWQINSSIENPVNPMKWCVYASGTTTNVNNVAYIDRLYSAGITKFSGELYTPLLDLDDTYQLSYQWEASPVGLDSSHPYDFQVKVVEDGTDIADAAVIWDFTDPEMLLESGVAPNAQGQLWSGWQFHTSKIDLTPWKGKKVRVAFLYKANTDRANCIMLDNVKVEQFDAATTPLAQFSQNSWNFGDVYIGSKMYSQVLTLTNTGTNGLSITSVDVPDGFGVQSDRDLSAISLKKNEEAKIQIYYAPQLTSAAQGNIVFHGNFPDVSIAVSATKKQVPAGGLFEGFESDAFPPAGWTASKWRTTAAGIEGDRAAIPNAYYQEPNYLQSPRIDGTAGPVTIEFSYADLYGGEQEGGADTSVRLKFSSDGGATWSVVDTYDYNDPYNEIIRKSYTRSANSDNCYWRFDWSLDYYDSETGAEAGQFYLDAVVLNNVYGANGAPSQANAVSPADGATGIFNRGVTLQWEPAQFASGYKLYAGTDAAATNLVNGKDLGNALSYELPALDYNTTYYWKVEPYNSKGTPGNIAVWRFTTIADPTVSTLPWRESFDNAVPPAGWNMTSDGTSYWAKNEISPYDGAASAMANPRSEGNTTILETPDVLLPADTPAFLTFYWGDGVAVSLLKPDTGVAENTTNGSDGISDLSFEIYDNGTWTQLALLSDKNNPYWIRERIDLAPYAGKRVAFRWVYKYYDYMNARGACIDNLTVELQADEKLSFNIDGWDAGKMNYNDVFTTSETISVINDGATDAEIASVTFANPNFSTSLRPGDIIASGKALTFTVTADAADAGKNLDDNLTITTKAGSTASFPVKAQVLAKDVRFFGFEDGKNGDLSVKDLTFIDADNKPAISLAFVDYPHRGDKIAFMVINYTLTDWPNPYPRTGKQCLVTFGPYDSSTQEDWIVSPRMTATANSSFDFCGRNYENKDNIGGGEVFGPGKATVLVSESTDPTDRNAYTAVEDFTLPYPVKEEYGEFSADLSAYAGKKIYVALRHTSADGLAYLYDDFQYNHFNDIELSGIENVAADGEAIEVSVTDNAITVAGTTSASISVVALSGATVASAEGNVMDISGIASGVYVAVVKAANGSKAIKFIKR